MMKRVISSFTVSACLLLPSAGLALAANPHTGGLTGQPSQTCQNFPTYLAVTPGSSFNSPGSAFNPGGQADSVYFGAQPQNSSNPKSVAQYDVACLQQSQHNPS
jgi:hypothetical protein